MDEPTEIVTMDLDGCAGLYAYAVKLGPAGRAEWDYAAYVENAEPYLRWLATSRAPGGADQLLGHLLQKVAIYSLDDPDNPVVTEAGQEALLLMARALNSGDAKHEAVYHSMVASLTTEAAADHAAALAGEGISIEPHRDPAKLLEGLAALYLPDQGGTKH